MTVSTAHQLIFRHFLKNDSISSDDIVKKFSPSPKKNSETYAAITIALKILEQNGTVVKETVKQENTEIYHDLWILKKPLIFNDQTVLISGQTAINISNILNAYYESVGNTNCFSNPIQISEADLVGLTELVNTYANSYGKIKSSPTEIK